MSRRQLLFLLTLTVLIALLTPVVSGGSLDPAYGSEPMRIKVVDRTGRPMPLSQVRVEPSGGATFFTDSRGIAAVRQPGFMGRTARAYASSFGHNYGAEFVEFSPGGSHTLRLQQSFDDNVADRTYRLTGAGIYRSSWIFGETTPIDNPLMNADVLTQGRAASTVFRDELVWFFGSTGVSVEAGRRKRVTAATSRLPDQGGLNPEVGVNLNYVTDPSGSARNVAAGVLGETVTVKGLMVTPTDPPQLFATFQRHSDATIRQGLLKWNESRKKFRQVKLFPEDTRVKLCPNVTRVRSDGREWFYFACPLPLVRVPATPKAIKDISRYQTFTPVKAGASWDGKHTERAEGNRWEWKTGTPTADHPRERELRRNFWFPDRAGIHHLTDFQTGESFVAREGTVFWNEFRQKWIMITNEFVPRGPRKGNVYYAEADSPIGPWVYARKVASHRDTLKDPYRGNFSFQDVKQHPELTRDEGKTIFFSGLFKRTARGQAVPRYNNNHLMYRLDLTDNRLHLPTPVYLNGDPNSGFTYGTARTRSDEQQDSGSVLFYANPADRPGTPGDDPIFKKQIWFSDVEPIPVWRETRQVNGGPATGLTTEKTADVTSDTPAFYAWPSGLSLEQEQLTGLLEYQHPSESVLIYVPEGMTGFFERNGWSFGGTVANVWSSPRLDPPTDASARPIREWSSTITIGGNSGGGSGSEACVIERAGVAPEALGILRAARDRILPTVLGRWITGRYYDL